MTTLQIDRMPDRVRLGEHIMSTMAFPMRHAEGEHLVPYDRRIVMGFCLPSWQRGFVWSEAQKIAFIESAWRGLNLETEIPNPNRPETLTL